MQKTRLTVLMAIVVQQFSQALRNPWRRISLLLVSLLFGNFAATVVATITGQAASWDVLVAIVLVLSCEVLSWIAYHQRSPGPLDVSWSRRIAQNATPEAQSPPMPRSALIDVANAVKIGLIYGLFVEALKLGS